MTARSEQLHAAFTARLERVRGKLSDAEFTHLVDDMVSTAQRLEEIEARSHGLETPLPGAIHTFKEPEIRS